MPVVTGHITTGKNGDTPTGLTSLENGVYWPTSTVGVVSVLARTHVPRECGFFVNPLALYNERLFYTSGPTCTKGEDHRVFNTVSPPLS